MSHTGDYHWHEPTAILSLGRQQFPELVFMTCGVLMFAPALTTPYLVHRLGQGESAGLHWCHPSLWWHVESSCLPQPWLPPVGQLTPVIQVTYCCRESQQNFTDVTLVMITLMESCLIPHPRLNVTSLVPADFSYPGHTLGQLGVIMTSQMSPLSLLTT